MDEPKIPYEGASPQAMLANQEIEKVFLAVRNSLHHHNVQPNVALAALVRLQVEYTAQIMAHSGFMQVREPERTRTDEGGGE